MLDEQWKALTQFLQAFATPLMGVVAYLLRKILEEMRELNTRVTKIEARQETHEQIDDARFELIRMQMNANGPQHKEM